MISSFFFVYHCLCVLTVILYTNTRDLRFKRQKDEEDEKNTPNKRRIVKRNLVPMFLDGRISDVV